jgi:predicted ATPase/class 3 adenylate cyclase
MSALPTGTVTFLFTDVEGSTRLLQHLGDAGWKQVFSDHRRLLREAIESAGGHLHQDQGESFFFVFQRAKDAIQAAVRAQRALAHHPWPEGGVLRVRMGLHTGEPAVTEGEYSGLDVHRAARILQAGHGGQILVSQTTQDLVAHDLPVEVSLRDLGAHRLKDLQQAEHIYQVSHPDLTAEFPPVRSLDLLPNNLPIQLTSFIGRERETAEIKRLLAATRLLTLTGGGGSGKTRLALQVGGDRLGEYPDGVWLVELAAISDPALVPQTVASCFPIREQAGRPLRDTLLDYLRSRDLLLVLDNCEHLLEACATLTRAILQACGKVSVLATSREPLGVPGEVAFRVPPLSLPDPQQGPTPEDLMKFEAVRLFVERALAAVPDFTVTDRNAGPIESVCRQLDGIPLALEMAAARVRALSVDQIATRLDDRFRLLTRGNRLALPHHQTLRATLDWSYDLLSEKEQALLRRVSVFSGGFDLEAVEAVCSGDAIDEFEILDVLTNLVDKSLVLSEQLGREVRYRLLETVRQYGRDRLTQGGDAAEAHRRHRDYYLGLAEKAEPLLTSAEEVTWLSRLETEHDNLRSALAWSIEQRDFESGLRLAGALGWFWYVRGYFSEGRERLERALEAGDSSSPSARAKALYQAGILVHSQGDFQRASELNEQSLALYRSLDDRAGIARASYLFGMLNWSKGDYAAARAVLEESLQMFRDSKDLWGIASALRHLGHVSFFREEYEYSTISLEESLALYRKIGYKRGIGYSLLQLGNVARYQNDNRRARPLLEESLTLFKETGERNARAFAVSALGKALVNEGAYDQASALIKEGLNLQKELGAKWGIAECLTSLAAISVAREQAVRGVRLLAVAEGLRGTIGRRLHPVDQSEFDRMVAALRAALGEQVFKERWDEGRAMTLDDAIRYALEADT